MEKIDIHEDLILSFRHDTASFFRYHERYRDILGVNAGNLPDYKVAELTTIFGVIRPYHITGHGANGPLLYDKELIAQGVQRYTQLTKDGDVSLLLQSDNLDSIRSLRLLLHIEGCDHIQNIQDIEDLYTMGIRSLGFVRNFDNNLSHCNLSSTGGLSTFGQDTIEYMNHRGMIIDTAHMNHSAMMETLDLSQKPIINSHSNLQHFQKHSRNVYDEFIIKLANKNGVLGLSMCSDFISGDGNIAYIEQYIDQLKYIINIAGEDVVCFGSDFHGILQGKETIQDFNGIRSLGTLEELIGDTFGTSLTEKFFSTNAYRVISANLS